MAERVEVRRATRVECAGTREVLARLSGGDAGRGVDEGRKVPRVERQILDVAAVDDRADLGRIRPEQRCRCHDRGGFLDAAHFEQHVNPRTLIHFEDNAFSDPLLEALHVDFDRIGPGGEKGRGVGAGAIGDERVGRPFVHFANGDVRAGDDAVGVADRPDDGACGDLGGTW